MLNLVVDNQQQDFDVPSEAVLKMWAAEALPDASEVEVSLVIVDEAESQRLNNEYRGKDKPTNVLSFPMDIPEDVLADVETKLLGDLVICAAVVEKEAAEQKKSADAHWAHMIVHGMLHLQGFDHVDEADAELMESTEIYILKQLGFTDPYQTIVE